MNTLIICDIDGVLADCGHRLHFKEEGDYKCFYGPAMLDDPVIAKGFDFLKILFFATHADLWLLTGRPERTRTMTEQWVKERWGSYVEHTLLMRADGDHSKSPEMKVKELGKFQTEMKSFDTVFFIDDDPENVIAVEKAFPHITGITFTTKRFRR